MGARYYVGLTGRTPEEQDEIQRRIAEVRAEKERRHRASNPPPTVEVRRRTYRGPAELLIEAGYTKNE